MPAADALSTPRDDLRLLADAARDAGQLALEFFGRNPRVWHKDNKSPVSEADMAVDAFLARQLTGARPGYGWLSEETTDDESRFRCRRLFVVDPIDGTRAFIGGDADWTVSLAVVEAGRPLAAALYAPVEDDLYLAIAGGGATLNDTAIAVSDRTSLDGAHVAGPRSMRDRTALMEAGLNQESPIRSLALRIALVAAGRRDAAIATARAHDWDLAAADLLVQEAGGRLTDLDGNVIRYNEADIHHPALIAAPAALAPALGDLVRSVVR